MRPIYLFILCCAAALLAGCSGKTKTELTDTPKSEPAPSYFKVDPATAGAVSGTIRYTGKKPAPKVIDMSEANPPALRRITEKLTTNRWS